MYKSSLFSIVFFLCGSMVVFSQETLFYYDSLYQIGETYRGEKKYEEAVTVYNQLKDVREWMGDPSNARKVYNSLGYSFYMSQAYDSSAYHYQTSNQMAIVLKDTGRIVASYKSLALAYRVMGLYAKALNNNQYALTLAKITNDYQNIIDIANSTGLIYYHLKDIDKALDAHREALRISLEVMDSSKMAAMYNNIAMSQFSLGHYDSSLFYNMKSLELKTKLNFQKVDRFSTLNNIGEDYLALDSLELAEKYLTEANQLCIDSNNHQGVIACSSNLAKLALKRNDYITAGFYLETVGQLLKKTYVKDLHIDYLELNTSLLEKQGKYAEALASHKELAALREEVFQSEQLDVQRVEASYALREKQLEAENHAQEAALARAESRRNAQLMLFLLAGLIVAGLVAFFFIQLNRRLRESNRIIKIQKLDLKHATYNTLMRIQSLLRLTADSMPDTASKEKLQQVESAIVSAASLQQFTYNVENEGEVSLGQFLEALVARLKEAFDSSGLSGVAYRVEVGEDALMPMKTVLNCGLIVGEIVTNSVKYAFSNNTANPQINISLTRSGPYLLLRVRDNGVGIAGEGEKKGVGTGLIHRLARYIKAELSVQNSEGTSYTLKLKCG